jgi:hypothetical protein
MSSEPASLQAYQVVITPFARRHFIKGFEKKYRKAWDVTLDALQVQCAHIETMIKNNRIPAPIHATADNQHWILKHSFAVAGRNQSPRRSGNRVIIYVDRTEKVVYLLLVYHKTDLGDGDETEQWHTLIRAHHADLIERFNSSKGETKLR